MNLPISTPRLLLRLPTEADLPGYLSYRNETATLEAQMMKAVDEQDARSFLQSQSGVVGIKYGWRMLSVELSDAVGIIGEVGVFVSDENSEQGDLGWWLHPDHRKKGYAFEAVTSFVHWCFTEYRLHRLTAHTLSANLDSRNLMSKLGMRLESETIRSVRRNGRWHDEVGYAILREEWQLRKR
ncbi:GNAT family N-acetyltransferase [Rhizobium sp. 16-449-1b]|uniref:GNAT family N-acetyltransferase n=1 Tax=Rhizobium sp. 16-449-1b TaxID=2819989 RepID=UPI001ADA88B9|nr:GNAT family N-acetyltransferase [Rhizobium sp. 16-449-1b]MBO9195938.1 GNAT family N-acetyltransferase [Rhizobium sp. 16-449-1b]